MGSPRVSVYLFSSSTAMNSLTKLGHQVDAEISGFQVGTKETVKAFKILQELNVKLEHGPILIVTHKLYCHCVPGLVAH